MLHALRSLAVFLILLAGVAGAAEVKPFTRDSMLRTISGVFQVSSTAVGTSGAPPAAK